MILDDDDERLWFRATGSFEAEVLPERDEDDESEGQWQSLHNPEEMVQFYDPTDLFGDLAETIAEQYPDVAPDDEDDSAAGEESTDERADAPGAGDAPAAGGDSAEASADTDQADDDDRPSPA